MRAPLPGEPAIEPAAQAIEPPGFLVRWLQVLGFQGIGFGITAATVALAVAVVPPAVYGEYGSLVSAVQLVASVALSWVAQSSLRFAREEFGNTGAVGVTLRSALGLQGLVYVAGALLAGLAAFALRDVVGVSGAILLPAALAVLALAAFETASYVAQGAGLARGLGAGALITKLGPFAAVLAIWWGMPASAPLLLAGMAAGFAAAFLFTLQAVPRVPRAGPRIDRETARRIIGYGAILPISAAAGATGAAMHVWFVRGFAGLESAGAYAWAGSVYALLIAPLLPLASLIAPRMIDNRLAGRSAETRGQLAAFLAAVVLSAAALPLLIALLRCAVLALPDRYAAAGPILCLLVSALPAQMLASLTSPIIMAHDSLIGSIVKINFAAVLAAFAANAMLTPWLGGFGAALALSVSIWTAAILLYRLASRTVPVELPQARSTAVRLVALGTVVAAGDMMLLQVPLVLLWPLAGLMSTVMLLVLRQLAMLSGAGEIAQLLRQIAGNPPVCLTRFLAWCENGGRRKTGTGRS